jgi:hypothetical protein
LDYGEAARTNGARLKAARLCGAAMPDQIFCPAMQRAIKP